MFDTRNYKCTTHCRKCAHFDFYKAKCKAGRVNLEMLNKWECRKNPDLRLYVGICKQGRSEVEEVMELINKALNK